MALNRLASEVHVLRLLEHTWHEKVVRYEEEEDDSLQHALRPQATTWQDLCYHRPKAFHGRTDLVWQTLSGPLTLSFPEVPELSRQLREKLESIKPDFVWAEWALSGAVAAASRLRVPWIYAHHDWGYRLAALRRAAAPNTSCWSDQLLQWSLRQAEIQIVRKSTAVVTGSQTEAREIRAVGGNNVSVIPTLYRSVAVVGHETPTQPRIVHLGGLGTTSNHLGLKAYLERVHPQLTGPSQNALALWIIGDTTRGKPELLRQLKDIGARVTGHVRDLGTVLRPFDLAIIPYEHNTGTRTKLSLLFNYAQVVLATNASVAGSPELVNGRNCVLLDSLDQFPNAIISLLSDPARRARLGQAAKATFERCFTLDAQLPAFERVLSQCQV